MKDEHFSCFFPNFGWFWFPVELIEPGRRVTTQRQAAWWDLSSWGMKRERNLGCECACSRSFSHMCNMYIITIIINNYNDYIYIYIIKCIWISYPSCQKGYLCQSSLYSTVLPSVADLEDTHLNPHFSTLLVKSIEVSRLPKAAPCCWLRVESGVPQWDGLFWVTGMMH